LEEVEHGIALKVVVNGLLTGDAPQAFGRLIAKGEDLLDQQRMGLGKRALACS